jgi:CubicO group peptidase (beta-lactamase class C family)
VLKLVDKGLFDAGRQVHEYFPKPLPEYPEYADLGADSRYKRLTAFRILCQRSGLVNARRETADRRLAFSRSPGMRFGYSDEGSRLLQFVLERKFGQGIESLAQQIVFDFLGLRRMSYRMEPRFERHVASLSAAAALPTEPDITQTLVSSASDFNRFMWYVVVSGGAFSDPYIGLPYHNSQVLIHSYSITRDKRPSGSPRRKFPLALGWSLGWAGYYIPGYKVKFLGPRSDGGECFATVIGGLPGKITALTIFAFGRARRSVTGRILSKIIGEIEAPLEWLDFYE